MAIPEPRGALTPAAIRAAPRIKFQSWRDAFWVSNPAQQPRTRGTGFAR